MADDVVRIDDQPEDEFTRLLRRTLAAEADEVVPQDRFAELLDRIERSEHHEPEAPRPSRLRWLSAAAVLALAVGLAVPWLVGQVVGPDQDPATRATPTTSASTTTGPTSSAPTSSGPPVPVTAGSSLPTTQRRVAVYYLGEDGLLYREFRDLPTQRDRLTTAVAAVLNAAPLDPSYRSAWAGGQVNEATLEGNLLTIDLSSSAFKGFTNRETAEQAIQQVVYTAIGAVGDRTGDKGVRILMDGQAELPVLGTPAEAFTRQGNNPLAPLWVTVPETGQAIPQGTMVLSGYLQVDVPDPVVVWRVTDEGGTTVGEGEVSASGDDSGWRSWQVAVELPAGTYQLTVGLAEGGHEVVKSFTVTD